MLEGCVSENNGVPAIASDCMCKWKLTKVGRCLPTFAMQSANSTVTYMYTCSMSVHIVCMYVQMCTDVLRCSSVCVHIIICTGQNVWMGLAESSAVKSRQSGCLIGQFVRVTLIYCRSTGPYWELDF